MNELKVDQNYYFYIYSIYSVLQLLILICITLEYFH